MQASHMTRQSEGTGQKCVTAVVLYTVPPSVRRWKLLWPTTGMHVSMESSGCSKFNHERADSPLLQVKGAFSLCAHVSFRVAKQNFGDKAVLNHLPDGSLNPLRFTRHRTDKTNMYPGKLHRKRG
jgi:hypothetical protein